MKFLFITLIVTFFIFANGGGIWPHPANIEGGNLNYQISPQITFQVTSNSNSLLLSSIERYKKYIVPKNNYNGRSDGTITQIQLTITNNTTNLQLGISEKYILNISQPVSYIYADTVFGAMRALESFSQLLKDNKDGSSNIEGAPYYILDEPRFMHRGLMIDTARHYLPLDVIFRAIDGLSYLKMNVLHWHVTDAQSYPMRWKSYPEFSIKGSWSEDSYYTPQNVTAVVQYGLERGIRILPEFDMPGHSYSLGLAYNNFTAKCPAYYINVDNVPLDPSNEFVYQVLDSVIAEMSSYWLDDYIHLGGDEVVYDCWTADSKISQWMNQMGFTPNQAMQYFESKVQAIAQKYGKKVINWEEVFTCGINVPSTTVIEVWMDEQTLLKVANAGKGAILAYGWYLDHLQDNWVNFYTQEPFNSPEWNSTNKQFVLGGEACAWGEQINFSNFDSRVWTRTSATAERLWSPKDINVPYQAAPRLMQHICRLNARGILAEPISPGTC